jgi:hypothetical protein
VVALPTSTSFALTVPTALHGLMHIQAKSGAQLLRRGLAIMAHRIGTTKQQKVATRTLKMTTAAATTTSNQSRYGFE